MLLTDRRLVHRAVELLERAACRPWLFGGWAEELRGLAPPRPHRDIDLLLDLAELPALEACLRADPGAEVRAKRLPHKRAFLLDGVMVEVLVVERVGLMRVTDHFGLHRHVWPADVMPPERIQGLRVASAQALREYRRAHAALPRYASLTLAPDAAGVLRPAR